jgi:hypothetical protein
LSCDKKSPDSTRQPLLEVEGKFLYLDQVEAVLPPGVSAKDSTRFADSYIKKWITDVLMYENAKRNVTDKDEIERLLEDYRKSLTIHQYQQKLIRQRLPNTITEEELQKFYEEYKSEFILRENIIRGILLVLPKGSPKIDNVRSWVKSGKTKDLEQIEKYSIQHALSYDYFGETWTPLNVVLKKMPVQIEDPASFASSNRFFETSDSLTIYMLKVNQAKRVGEAEPLETAKEKIISIIMNQKRSDLISDFESELYKDAIDNETVTFFNKK